MITRKAAFFSVFFWLFLFFACSEVQTKQLYSGYNQKGVHSRALSQFKGGFIVGGARGVYSVFDAQFKQFTDSLEDAEDLRDVHVLSDGSMIFINSGDRGKIWKVAQNGQGSYLTYDRNDVFIDGIAFWNDQNGIAFCDPVQGKFMVLITSDAGASWNSIDYNIMPFALPNEGGFAASGTSIAAVGESTVMFGTGMADTARLYCSYDRAMNWTIKNTPIKAGDSYGIYSMYFWSEKEGVIIGGSYLHPEDTENLCFSTHDGGDSWIPAGIGLGGYTSCVHGNEDGSFLVATGRVGTYYSLDKGANWGLLFNETFYSVFVSQEANKTTGTIYFSGKEGKVAVHAYNY